MKFEVKQLPKSEVEIKIVVDEKEFESYHTQAFQAVQKEIEIDGFRKGNAPETIVVQKYGEMIIVEEMGNLALRDAYIKAIDDHKINPIAQPSVTITKIAKGSTFEATIIVPIMPEVSLPEYKKIASKVTSQTSSVAVEDEEVTNVIEELRKGRSHGHSHDDHDHDHDHHDHDHNHDHSNEDKADLPEIDDAFAQSFGEQFKTLEDLKAKIKENLTLEKEHKIKEKKRTEIVDELIKETKADIPQVLIDGEIASMMAQFKADITRFGGTWNDYLAHAKKTEDEIKESWKDDAYKRAMSQIILHKIAEVEKLQATEAEVEVELVRLLAQVQDADEERAKAYLYQALTTDKVFRFLEESK